MDTKRELKKDRLGTDHQEKYGEGKEGGGGGANLGEVPKKNMKGEILRKKNSFTARSLRKILASAFRKILKKS